MKNALLQVKDLCISFSHNGQEIKAVRNLSFTLQKGEILGIVGESGCGKSTAAQALLKLLPPYAMIKNGEILLENEDILQKTTKEISAIRGKRLSMIFQDPFVSLNPSKKVGKQIIETMLCHKLCSKQEAEKIALTLLELVGISEPSLRFHQHPHELSGGTCQKIAIASALAANPQILIADEPTTALDSSIQMQILALLKELQVKKNMSMIVISHDLSMIKSLCNRVLIMYAGQIVEEGPVEEILKSPKHPYTEALLQASPHFADPSQKKLRVIPGSPPHLSPPPQGCAFKDRCPHAMKICIIPPPVCSMPSGQKAACWLLDPRRKK